MVRIALALGAAWVLLVLAPSAHAGAVILEGGDVLRGEVSEEGGVIVVIHAALGRLELGPHQVREVHPDIVAPSAPTLASRAAIDAALSAVVDSDPYFEAPREGDRLLVAGEAPKSPWTYGIGIGGSLTSGNSDTLDAKVDADAKYERGSWLWSAALAYAYGEQDGTKNSENWHGKTRAERRISGCAYGFGQVTFDRDLFAKLEHRWIGLAGVGTVLGESRYASLKGEVGGGMTFEQRVAMDATNDPSAYLGLEYLYEDEAKRRFLLDLDFVPNLADFDLSVTTLDARFEVPCSASLNFSLGFRLDWVIDPPNAKPVDTLFTIGLRWRE